MEDLRLTFLIFGIVAIIAILVHGMWTIRKNAKGNEKAKFESRDWQNKSDPSLGDDDSFDAHGVGSVRVISTKKTVDNDNDEKESLSDDSHETTFSKGYDDEVLPNVSSDEHNNMHSEGQYDADELKPEQRQDSKTEAQANDDQDITVTKNS